MRADPAAPTPPLRAAAFLRRSWPDLLGLAWIVLLAFLYLSPALKDGPSFGPADIGQGMSLLTRLVHAAPDHNVINGDQITQGIPWNTLDWQLVHRGELPLWNDLSGNGMPQLLNFESAPLALPTLVGYLFPLELAFLVTMGVKLLLMGTGTYLLCRLLRARPLAAAFGGTTAMLSGAFAGWLGWSITGPDALVGWVAAGVLLCVRHRRGPGPVVLLALSVAFAIYGGFPESYVLLAFALGVLLALTYLLARLQGARYGAAAALRVGLGGAGGLALAAPLWLPGIAVLRGSVRAGTQAASGLPLHMAGLLLAQGYYGLPIAGSAFFGPWNYYETAAYVGVIALVACAVAVVSAWRRPVVLGLVVAILASCALVYDLGSKAPVQHLVVDVGLGAVALQRILPLVGFLVAVLAALGLERLVGAWRERSVRVGLWAGAVLVAAALGALWSRVGSAAFAPGAAASYTRPGAPPPSDAVLAGLREASLWWPTGSLAAVVVGALLLSVAARRQGAGGHGARRGGAHRQRQAHGASGPRPGGAVGAAFLAAQSAFLLFAGVGINSYAPSSFPTTSATATLARVVGTDLVGIDDGLGACAPPRLVPPSCGVRRWGPEGFYPEVNLGYGIDELGLHDPTIPKATFDGWPIPGTGRSLVTTNLFVPDIDTVALARRYGVAYVLVGPGLKVPAGMRPVATLEHAGAKVVLAAVPGSSRFSVTGPGATVRSSRHPGDARYELAVSAPSGGELVARITDVPGWRARAGGRSLAVRQAPGNLLEIRLPPGTTQVTLAYDPGRLVLGELLALAALVALCAWVALGALARRGRLPSGGRVLSGGRHATRHLVDHAPGALEEAVPSQVPAGSLERWPPVPSSDPTPTRSTPSSSSTSEPSTPS